MSGDILKFKKNPKWVHKRSEGLTRRGQARQERLMLGKSKSHPCQHPRKAVNVQDEGTDLIQTTYKCKKCGKVWTETLNNDVVVLPIEPLNQDANLPSVQD